MKKNIALIVTFAIATLFVFTGCQNRKPLKDFKFTYSVESEESYKIIISFDSKKHFRIERYNYLMDNIDKTRHPFVVDSVMTDAQYKKLSKLMAKTDFFKMKDAYGFDKEDNGINILHQVSFETGGQQKYITIRNVQLKELPRSFVEVLHFISEFMKTYDVDKMQSQEKSAYFGTAPDSVAVAAKDSVVK